MAINPAYPTSVGALLSEEWTINPFSTLPSFLEMTMIQEASRATLQTIDTALDMLVQKLELQRDGPAETFSNSRIMRLRHWLLEKRARVAKTLSLFLSNYKTEVKYLMIYAVERHCLLTKDATLSEALYGTKRVKLRASTDSSSSRHRRLVDLTEVDRTRLLLLMVLVPYLKEKLDDYQKQTTLAMGGGQQEQPRDKRRRILLQLMVHHVYPLLRQASKCVNLICQWRFLMGRAVCFDVRSVILQQVVRRITQADVDVVHDEEEERMDPAVDAPDATDNGYHPILYVAGASILFSWLTQIRSDYQERDRQQRSQSRSLVPPPSPPITRSTTTGTTCPLCQRAQQQHFPTATPSGYVYCRACIVPYVKRHGQCPVTGEKCHESQLILVK